MMEYRVVAITPLGRFVGKWSAKEELADFATSLADLSAITQMNIVAEVGSIFIPAGVVRQSVITIERRETNGNLHP